MASPFAKYQSEQVQQMAPGFVEAYAKSGAAIGQGLQQAGSAIAHGMEVSEAKKQEEAKMQGMLSPYLKTDQRVQSVKQQLAAGWMKKDDAGNVFIPDEHKDKFDPAKANDAISFYNETGGDGSKLTGTALTKFATAFEAEKKYAAEQAGLEDKRIEKLKTLAEIRKMEAETAEKYGKVGRAGIIGAFGAGADMSTYSPPGGNGPVGSILDGTPYANGGSSLASRGSLAPPASPTILSNTPPAGVFNADLSGRGFSLTPSASPNGFTPERYNAGAPLVQALSAAEPSATQSTPTPTAGTTSLVPAALPAAVTAPMDAGKEPRSTSEAYIAEIPKLQQARVELDNSWQKDISAFSANYQIGLSRLTAMGGTTEELKAYNEEFASMYKLKADRYQANIASIADRLKGFEATAEEARKAQAAALAQTATELAKKADTRATESAQREKDKAEMTKIEFEAKYGKPVEPGKEAPASDKKATFAATIQGRIQGAGVIAGRTAGTEQGNLRRAAQEEHTKIMKDYPTWYNIGLTTKGGDEYQFDLTQYPTSAPIDATIKAKVDENATGYHEGRVFLTQLLSAVNSTDEGAIKNYLDRFLLTTGKDITQAQGELLGQFGVAAFRKAITSGGNFSDADREYVKAMITQINSPAMWRTKDKMLAQTKVLAEFIDSRFRAGMAAQGVRLDLAKSEEFLKREGDQLGLETLAQAKQFYTAYGISPTKTTIVSRDNSSFDVESLRQRADAARSAGNEALAKDLEKFIDDRAKATAEAEKKASETATKAAAAKKGKK
jgi:hypothetical protein